MQVTRLALRLFEELRPLHHLGERPRRWLHWAAVLHDIGWVEGQKGHHKTALRRIVEDTTLPLGRRVRGIVACVARYHRKALPSDRHGHFAALAPKDRRTVCMLAGILRVADGLDRTHANVVTDVGCEVSAERLTIICAVVGPAGAELEAARAKADLLERVLGRAVAIEPGDPRRPGRPPGKALPGGPAPC